MTTPNDIDAAREWQPIETAPKDGTRILVWVPQSENVLSVYWDDRFAYVGNDDGTEQWYEGAWTDDAVKSWGDQEKESYEPTYWMPTPPPPKERR